MIEILSLIVTLNFGQIFRGNIALNKGKNIGQMVKLKLVENINDQEVYRTLIKKQAGLFLHLFFIFTLEFVGLITIFNNNKNSALNIYYFIFVIVLYVIKTNLKMSEYSIYLFCIKFKHVIATLYFGYNLFYISHMM